MTTESPAAPASTPKAMLWAGWILTILPSLLFVFTATIGLIKPAFMAKEMAEGSARTGWPEDLNTPLGIIVLVCVVLYLIPRTSVLGAILLTGYLGGAIATHVRIGEPWIMPFVVGVIVWLGLFLRDARIRALIPIKR